MRGNDRVVLATQYLVLSVKGLNGFLCSAVSESSNHYRGQESNPDNSEDYQKHPTCFLRCRRSIATNLQSHLDFLVDV